MRRPLHLLLAATLSLSALAAAAGPAHALSCNAANHVLGDLDSDGIADVVVGVPEYDDARGAVDISFSTGVRKFLTVDMLGLPASAPGDRFGAAVAVHDLDMNGCDDLVVGAPGRNSSAGAVYLARGVPSSDLSGGRVEYSPVAHGSFGASLAILAPEHWNGSEYVRSDQQLVVGAPTADDSGRSEAGAVYVYQMMAGDDTLSDVVKLTQNSAGVPGTSESFDRWGTVLAGWKRTIAVGAPDEAVGTRAGAGAVTFLTSTRANPVTFAGVGITQDSAGVPGTAEAGDHFGASLAMLAGYVAIGTPDENLGTARDTGVVQLGRYTEGTRTFTATRALSQDSAGIPGSNESGDHFGAAVALVNNLHEQTSVAIGAPGENVGSVVDAGAVTLVRVNGTPTLPGITLTQNSAGIPDIVQAGDRFGAALGALPGDLDDGEGMIDGLAIGAPGEDLGAISDPGAVTFTRGLPTWHQLVLEDTGGPIPAEVGFGSVLAAPGATAH